MGEVNYYLKKAEESTGHSLIYLQFKYKGNKLVFSFGQSIDPKNWNANNKQTTSDGDHSLNDLLDNLKEVCEKAYKEELRNGVPTVGTLKAHLVQFINQNTDAEKVERETFFSLLDRFISGEVKISRGEKKKIGRSRAQSTIDNYDALKKHLITFQAMRKYRIDFDTINKDFFNKYTSFLKDHLPARYKGGAIGVSNATIAKDIRKIKVVMGEAVEMDYTNNQEFKKGYFSYVEDETDSVSFSDQELIKLFRFDFTNNKRLERVRDLFVFSSFIGLRYSDIVSIGPDNIVDIDGELFIKTITQKTAELVIIPCNPIVLKIFERYTNSSNRLPRALENQVYNRYLKELCRIAGFTEKGRLSTDPKKELCECVSSHTARRSFATNLYLDGYPVSEIMKCTGHKTEKAFWKYIKVSKLDSAKRLSKHQKANWSAKILQVERAA
jgi:integrase